MNVVKISQKSAIQLVNTVNLVGIRLLRNTCATNSRMNRQLQGVLSIELSCLCCSVLQCVMPCVAVCCSVCCRVMQCDAVCVAF